jgi:hypothetical protein
MRKSVFASVLAVSYAAGAPCNTAADCSLNGDCVQNVCVCDAAWNGSATCDVLSILPADKATGYHTSASSWGGTSVQDSLGIWHLYAAEMINGCGLSSWKGNSVVMHATGFAQNGPFTRLETAIPQFGHNPKAFLAPDNITWLIYNIGGGTWQSPTQNCTGSSATSAFLDIVDPVSPTGDGCGPEPPLNGGCGIFIASSNTPYGPWQIQPLIIRDQNRSALLDCTHTNPSPVFLPNGTVLLAFNAGYCHNHLETIGIATAPHWSGPYTLLKTEPIFLDSNGNPHQCEDPTLWVTERGWHMMVHNFGSQISLYAHSEDAYTWILHTNSSGPYSGSIAWTDGTNDSLDVERPQLLWSSGRDGVGHPTFLVNGALYGNGSSFTLFRPLAQP